jgi:acetylornithine deacetylase/succinyl-diaminopimelate desuccinylase-like protein
MNRLVRLLLLPLVAAFSQDARVEYVQLAPELIRHRLEMVGRKLPERKSTLESLFQEAGCMAGNISEQPVHGPKEPNIICTLEGEKPGTIVVGGHYDLADRGMGAVDDWSGAVLLPSLYQSLKATPRRHRFKFVAFAREEVGSVGSHRFVDKLAREERTDIRAMINLECLGMTPPEVWASRADSRLFNAYAGVARSLGLAVIGANVDRVGDDDSHPFLNAGIPVITIHSVTTETLHILHSPADNLKAINSDYYYAAYRLAAAYLAYLDTVLE